MTESVEEFAELAAFRAEARDWIARRFPRGLAGQGQMVLAEAAPPGGEFALWKAHMAERGWGAPTWPRAYGGGGLSAAQAAVLAEELVRAEAFNPMVLGQGLTMIGPTLLEYGTEDQKRRHLPAITAGERIWCLGYSEPNAGSDLSALQTRCQPQGDHWVVQGQKIWTSHAHYSHWCGALVRTDPGAARHEGVSFVLLRMDQPGVEVRPIQLIAGPSPFCEIFFDGARVEANDVLGPLHGGWAVGKRLLEHERASQMGEGVLNPVEPPALQAIARDRLGLDGAGRLDDPDLRARLTTHLMRAHAHTLTLRRLGAAPAPGAASLLKNSASEIGQARAELLLEILGWRGLGWSGAPFSADELKACRSWLYSKAMTIYGGTAEIQANIIAKRTLGLPDVLRRG